MRDLDRDSRPTVHRGCGPAAEHFIRKDQDDAGTRRQQERQGLWYRRAPAEPGLLPEGVREPRLGHERPPLADLQPVQRQDRDAGLRPRLHHGAHQRPGTDGPGDHAPDAVRRLPDVYPRRPAANRAAHVRQAHFVALLGRLDRADRTERRMRHEYRGSGPPECLDAGRHGRHRQQVRGPHGPQPHADDRPGQPLRDPHAGRDGRRQGTRPRRTVLEHGLAGLCRERRPRGQDVLLRIGLRAGHPLRARADRHRRRQETAGTGRLENGPPRHRPGGRGRGHGAKHLPGGQPHRDDPGGAGGGPRRRTARPGAGPLRNAPTRTGLLRKGMTSVADGQLEQPVPERLTAVVDLIELAGRLTPSTAVVPGGHRVEDLRLVESARDHGIVDRIILVGDKDRIAGGGVRGGDRDLAGRHCGGGGRRPGRGGHRRADPGRRRRHRAEGRHLHADHQSPHAPLGRAVHREPGDGLRRLAHRRRTAPGHDRFGRDHGLQLRPPGRPGAECGGRGPRDGDRSAPGGDPVGQREADSFPAVHSPRPAAGPPDVARRRRVRAAFVRPGHRSGFSVAVKGLPDLPGAEEVAGQADVLVCPGIDAANILYKTIAAMNKYGQASLASVTVGFPVPYIILSRSDSLETRLVSIALCAVYARHRPRDRTPQSVAVAPPAKPAYRLLTVALDSDTMRVAVYDGGRCSHVREFNSGIAADIAPPQFGGEIQRLADLVCGMIEESPCGPIDAIVASAAFPSPAAGGEGPGGIYFVAEQRDGRVQTSPKRQRGNDLAHADADGTTHTSPKRQRGNDLAPSPARWASVDGGRERDISGPANPAAAGGAEGCGVALAAVLAERLQSPALVVVGVAGEQSVIGLSGSSCDALVRCAPGHVRSICEAARRANEAIGLPAEDVNLVVAHLGGADNGRGRPGREDRGHPFRRDRRGRTARDR